MTARSHDAGAGSHGETGLLPYVTLATQAAVGHTDEQAMFEAAARALRGSEDVLFILRLCEDGKRLKLAAASLGSQMVRALEAFIGGKLERQRRGIAASAVFADVLSNQHTRSTKLTDLCRALFDPDVAGKVAALLGGGHAWAVVTPLNHRADPVGLLCVVTSQADESNLAAVGQLAAVLNASLCATEVLRHVRKARSLLSADHPAQHYLGAATRAAGLGSPMAPRSLVPIRSVVSLQPNADRPGAWPCESPAPSGQPAPRARILLVEDEERIRKSTVALLAGLGYETYGVPSGELAIATYTRALEAQRPYDLILLDQYLSGRIGGVETLRIVRAVNPEAKAILISGQDHDASDGAMQRFGFHAVLAKPVALDSLNAAIEAVLAEPSA